jgi:phage shock protein A
MTIPKLVASSLVTRNRSTNEKPTAEKTWTQLKSHFAADHLQHKQIQGESAVIAGYHSANAAVTQDEDQMAEATIGELANLATAATSDRGGVAALTKANSRLAKQLEDNSTELRELKALLNQERRDRRDPQASTHRQAITFGHMATRLVRRTRAALATPLNLDTKQRQLEPITWDAVRLTKNDVQGRQL